MYTFITPMLTLSHPDTSSSHDSAKTHMLVHPFHHHALSISFSAPVALRHRNKFYCVFWFTRQACSQSHASGVLAARYSLDSLISRSSFAFEKVHEHHMATIGSWCSVLAGTELRRTRMVTIVASQLVATWSCRPANS